MLNCLFEKWYNDLVREINAWPVKKIFTFTSLMSELVSDPFNLVTDLVRLIVNWFVCEATAFSRHTSSTSCV